MDITATIKYHVNEKHSDYEECNLSTEKEYGYSDVFHFDSRWTVEDAIDYIRDELLLIAGGGYNWDGVESGSLRIEIHSEEENEIITQELIA